MMTRGTFASIKLQNRFIGKSGPKTLHIPSGQTVRGLGGGSADGYSVRGFVMSS